MTTTRGLLWWLALVGACCALASAPTPSDAAQVSAPIHIPPLLSTATSVTTPPPPRSASSTSGSGSGAVGQPEAPAAAAPTISIDELLNSDSASSTPKAAAAVATSTTSTSATEADELATSETVVHSTALAAQPPSDELVISTTDAPRPTTTTTTHKPINMTHIEEVYVEGHKDKEEIIDSWQRLSKRLKGMVGRAISGVVPYALNMTQEAKISSECSGAMLKWVLNLNQLKSWALRMLDASGKPIAGLLEGSMTLFGNYRECLKIRAPDDDEIAFTGRFHESFRGKYCIIQAKPWLPKKESPYYNLGAKIDGLVPPRDEEEVKEAPYEESAADDAAAGASAPANFDQNIFEELSDWILAFNFVNIRYDLCIPSSCTRMDIQKIMSYLLKDITEVKARVLRCEMDPPEGVFGGAVVESSSEAFEGAVNLHKSAMASSAAGATAAPTTRSKDNDYNDVYFSRAWSRLGWLIMPLIAITLVLLATSWSIALERGYIKKRRSRLAKTLNSLSLKRSVSSHLSVDYDQLADDKPLALYGLRFIFVIWVILVESVVNLNFEYLRELMMLKDLIFWWPAQVVINSTLQFDSIILLTAFTMSYKIGLNTCTKNLKSFVKFILEKYIRLMPSIMVMVALVIVLPMTYKGPVWNDYVLRQSNVCRSSGWLNTAFVQNYLPYRQICLPQTWLMCVEFQLIVIMSPILYYLNKKYINNLQQSNNSKRINYIKNSLTNNGNAKLKGDIFQNFDENARKATKMFYWIRTWPGLMLLSFILFGLAGSFYNVYSNGLPPAWFYTMADPESKALYFSNHMMKLWPHIAVFALGLLAGLECRRMARNIAIKSCVNQNYPYKNRNLAYESNANLNNPYSNNLLSASLPVISSDSFGSNANLSVLDEHSGDGNRQNRYQTNQLTINNNNNQLGSSNNNNKNSSSTSINNINNSYDNIYYNAGLTSKSVGDLYNDLEGGDDDNINLHNERREGSLSVIFRNIIGFLLAITTMSMIIFLPHEWSTKDLPKPLVAGLYDIGSRFMWSMALIWILFMVSLPGRDSKFGLLARGLGHPAMVCLGRLSFLIYIIHPFVHTAVLAIQEQPIYSSWLMLFHILIGNITITVILASVVSLFVEMPCRNLFRRCGASLLLTPTTVQHTIGHRTCCGHSNPGVGGVSNGANSADINSVSQVTTTTTTTATS